MTPYTSHGSYAIVVSNQVIFVDGRGPFNADSIKEFTRELATIAEKMKTGPWAIQVIYHGDSLLTPEAEEALVTMHQMRVQQGMVALAVVFNNVTAMNILKAQLSRAYDVESIPYRFFINDAEATDWLRSLGLTTGPNTEHGFDPLSPTLKSDFQPDD